MADLVKTTQQNSPNKLVKDSQPKKLNQKNLDTPDLELQDDEVQFDDELTEVAIAAADAPFAKAYSIYNKRFKNNLQDFQSYVRDSQQSVKKMLKNAIYEVHGVKESEMYGSDEDDKSQLPGG